MAYSLSLLAATHTMRGNASQTTKPNEFVIPKNQGYALTCIEISKVAEFLMKKLKPIKMEDLDPDDRLCAICHAELYVSEDERLSHAPVKTVCGHVFGKNCIMRWLDHLCLWLQEDFVFDNDPDSFSLEDSQSGCPICRRVFFPECAVQPLEMVLTRLAFWDMAYACAGVARSEKEERSRRYLWQYVIYGYSIIPTFLDSETELLFLEDAQECLLEFVKCLEAQTLTPVQEDLRRKLGRIGRKDLKKCLFKDGSFVFDIDRDDDERTEFEVEWETENEEEDDPDPQKAGVMKTPPSSTPASLFLVWVSLFFYFLFAIIIACLPITVSVYQPISEELWSRFARI
ncbi:hypothetical protein MMC07_005209 [Pseudocyphellaria aurata]|nr:hypothetical protein [Pseudocyphellaria aurata]